MEALSYVASFIATILGLCEPFWKKMRTILIFNFLGNLLVGMSYCLLGKQSGALICFVACAQVFINYYFDARGRTIPKPVIAVHAIVFFIVNVVTFSAWYDVLALVAAMLYVLSIAQSESKYYRILYVSNSAVWIGYDLLAGAYGNLITHVVLFVATGLAIMIKDNRISEKPDT